ncbi:MAG: site-specific integrase [Planctomycetes bacterium]|nr:site-specific integrase [Planctomycetota bacterium]
MLNAWVKFLDLETIQDITRGGVEKVAGRWEVQNTRWRWVRALTAFCRWCLDREYLAIHPLPRVSVKYDSAPESDKRQRALTEDELNSLLEVSPQSHQLWYITAIETGFRLSELQALRVSDYDSENRAIQLQGKFTKNGKPARQFISRKLSKLLDSHVAGKEVNAKLLDILSRASPTLQQDRQRANIEKITHKGLAGWHSFRKTLRTRLDKVPGCTPKIANAIMRHSEQGDVGLANYTDLDMKLLRQVFERTVRMSKFKY